MRILGFSNYDTDPMFIRGYLGKNHQRKLRGSEIWQNEHDVLIVIGSSIVMILIDISYDVVTELVQLIVEAHKEEEELLSLMETMLHIISRQMENPK